MKKSFVKLGLLSSLVGLVFSGCASSIPDMSSMSMGSSSAKTEATGSAGGSNSQNANSKLQRCDQPLGTIAINEDAQADWYAVLTRDRKLGSTVPVLKLLAQQSNCFVVVERGKAMANVMKERELEKSGELRKTSKMKKGQMVAADYTLAPSITFSQKGTGGAGAALGGLLGPIGAAVAGSMSSSDASTLLTLIDNRSSVQLAAAEGSARNIDFGMLGGLGFGGIGAAGGAYSNTPEGKVIVAAFTDSLNNLIISVRNYKAQKVKGGLGAGGNLKVQQD